MRDGGEIQSGKEIDRLCPRDQDSRREEKTIAEDIDVPGKISCRITGFQFPENRFGFGITDLPLGSFRGVERNLKIAIKDDSDIR
jgi:hypothetical protein